MYKEINTAHTEDKALFYKLINKQRQTGRERLNELIVNGETLSETNKIRQGWADYLKLLATLLKMRILMKVIRTISNLEDI